MVRYQKQSSSGNMTFQAKDLKDEMDSAVSKEPGFHAQRTKRVKEWKGKYPPTAPNRETDTTGAQ